MDGVVNGFSTVLTPLLECIFEKHVKVSLDKPVKIEGPLAVKIEDQPIEIKGHISADVTGNVSIKGNVGIDGTVEVAQTLAFIAIFTELASATSATAAALTAAVGALTAGFTTVDTGLAAIATADAAIGTAVAAAGAAITASVTTTGANNVAELKAIDGTLKDMETDLFSIATDINNLGTSITDASKDITDTIGDMARDAWLVQTDNDEEKDYRFMNPKELQALSSSDSRLVLGRLNAPLCARQNGIQETISKFNSQMLLQPNFNQTAENNAVLPYVCYDATAPSLVSLHYGTAQQLFNSDTQPIALAVAPLACTQSAPQPVLGGVKEYVMDVQTVVPFVSPNKTFANCFATLPGGQIS